MLIFSLSILTAVHQNIFMKYLKDLQVMADQGKQVKMKWLYEEDDEAMLELGEHYRDTAGYSTEIEMIV